MKKLLSVTLLALVSSAAPAMGDEAKPEEKPDSKGCACSTTPSVRFDPSIIGYVATCKSSCNVPDSSEPIVLNTTGTGETEMAAIGKCVAKIRNTNPPVSVPPCTNIIVNAPM